MRCTPPAADVVNVERADWTCRVCGTGIALDDEGDSWPTLADSQNFLREHARCLSAADAEEMRGAYIRPA
jgi:hypothetical protein